MCVFVCLCVSLSLSLSLSLEASHNYEVNAAGFEFNVFPKHFVVHVRHEQGSWVQQVPILLALLVQKYKY